MAILVSDLHWSSLGLEPRLWTFTVKFGPRAMVTGLRGSSLGVSRCQARASEQPKQSFGADVGRLCAPLARTRAAQSPLPSLLLVVAVGSLVDCRWLCAD